MLGRANATPHHFRHRAQQYDPGNQTAHHRPLPPTPLQQDDGGALTKSSLHRDGLSPRDQTAFHASLERPQTHAPRRLPLQVTSHGLLTRRKSTIQPALRGLYAYTNGSHACQIVPIIVSDLGTARHPTRAVTSNPDKSRRLAATATHHRLPDLSDEILQ